MKNTPSLRLLIISRKNRPGKFPQAERFTGGNRVRARTCRQALRRARGEGLGGIVVDLNFRDQGVDGMELALLLGEAHPGMPIWVFSARDDPRARALSRALAPSRRASARHVLRLAKQRSGQP